MQLPLHEHISYLERRVQTIKAALADADHNAAGEMDLRIELDLAERALSHFRRAFELEQRLFNVSNE